MVLYKFIRRNSRLLFFAWLILILIASSIPGLPAPKIKTSSGSSFRLDYLIHFLEFFILAVLFILGWMKNLSKKTIFIWIMFILLGIISAFCIEIFQWVIPGRRFNILDLYFNLMGLVFGTACFAFFYRKTKWFSFLEKKI